MKVEVVRVYRDGRILELDDQFHSIALGTGIEIQQRVLVETQLSQDALQAWIVAIRHKSIVKPVEKNSFGTEVICS
jgi:hypothetical protein